MTVRETMHGSPILYFGVSPGCSLYALRSAGAGFLLFLLMGMLPNY
jgi:hypothetical protein